jgi:hypothetical protein
MTAAMRAAAMPAGPRALRVAVVREGRIVEERMFRERSRVSGLVDDRLTLFEVKDGAWVLCVPNGATGHVVTSDGRADVGPLATRVRLDETARGKVCIGATKVLFQLVVPPPRPSRPQLPLATTHGEIDWTLTILVALSFLIHFGVIGATFSDWMDPVVASEDSVVGVIDMTSKLPGPMVEERSTSTPTSASTSTAASTSTSASTHARPSADARARALAEDAEAMKMSMLAVLGSGLAVKGALDRSEVPIGDLEAVARDRKGAEDSTGELHLAKSGGIATPGTKLTALGDGRIATSTTQARDVDGPKYDMSTPIPDPAPQLDLERVIAKLRPSFRSCYVRKGLSVDPSMEGKVTIEIRVAANGDVAGVTKVDGEGLSAAVEQCIIERAHNAEVTAPGGSGARARVPIIFRQQR